MKTFETQAGKPILMAMVKAVQENKAYLGEVDGAIGDGDHGMNMNKGFTLFAERVANQNIGFAQGLGELGTVLLTEIGGSMGPIYGTLFLSMAEAGEEVAQIGLPELTAMLKHGVEELYEIVDARVGDKTLVDTLAPALNALECAVQSGTDLPQALEEMKCAAQIGCASTKELVAKYGRASRLGERSRGVLDAGAVSCSLILCAMADGIAAVV